MNAHLNGGTYNLGHRNPEVIAALVEGTNYFDIGNHHFPSTARAQLAEKLAACTPEGLTYSIFSSGGSEAIDVALKCARYATKRKKTISIKMDIMDTQVLRFRLAMNAIQNHFK